MSGGAKPAAALSREASTVNLTNRWRDQEAEKRGMVVVEPGPHDIFLDIDDTHVVLEEQLRLAEAAGLEFEIVEAWPSRTMGHHHVHLRTEFSLNPALRIAIQAALGSDRQRELLSIARLMGGIQPPTVTFETPERAERILDAQAARECGINDKYESS